MGETFPHPTRTTRAIVSSPFGDEILLEYARFAISDMALGRNPGGAPTSSSSGSRQPTSTATSSARTRSEIADGTVRLDGSLGAFFDGWTDGRGGATLVFLTADHGVPRPRSPRTEGQARTGRLPERGPRGFLQLPGREHRSARARRRPIQAGASAGHDVNYALDESRNATEGAIAWFQEPSFYLNRPVLARRGFRRERQGRREGRDAQAARSARRLYEHRDRERILPRRPGLT